jgi:hypothetical protein
LPIRENFEWFGKNPVATLSNPTTSRVAASRKDTVPTPRYIITQSNNPMAIIPTPICKISTMFSKKDMTRPITISF